MPILLKLFPKIAEERTLPILFYEATITLIPKPDKNATQRKLQANITDEHRHKNPNQNFSKQNSTTHQKAHTPRSSWVIHNFYFFLFQCWQIELFKESVHFF